MGKEVSSCSGEGKDGNFEGDVLRRPLMLGMRTEDDGTTSRRANSHTTSRGGPLAHQQHKTAEQHPGPKARPDQCPDGEARFSPALQSKLRLQAHGIRCVHQFIHSRLQFYLRLRTGNAHRTLPHTDLLAGNLNCMGCAREKEFAEGAFARMRNERVPWQLRGPIKRNYFHLVKIGVQLPPASVQCAEHSVQYTVKQWTHRST
jgi:hypothetical protein